VISDPGNLKGSHAIPCFGRWQLHKKGILEIAVIAAIADIGK
jgi:hypothetical protein